MKKDKRDWFQSGIGVGVAVGYSKYLWGYQPILPSTSSTLTHINPSKTVVSCKSYKKSLSDSWAI
jgi:hypothetical protein